VSDTPFRRMFGARSPKGCRALELDAKHFKTLQEKLPAFSLHLLRMVIQRLERTNELLGVLQLRDPFERLAHYIHYLCRHAPKQLGGIAPIPLPCARVAVVLNLDRGFVDDCLEQMESAGIILTRKSGYLIPDENALLTFLPDLKMRVAA
jgi:CRP-like cAMP-binding protein